MTPERLHALYAEKIDRQIRYKLGSDVDREDLVQEVLMAVIRSFHTIREPKAADAWVRRVTTIKIVNLIRKRRAQPKASWEALSETEHPCWIPDDTEDLASRTVRVLKLLPASESSLLTSYWFTPATTETLARDLGCSVVTVKRRLVRARTRFYRLALLDPELARYAGESRDGSRDGSRWPASRS